MLPSNNLGLKVGWIMEIIGLSKSFSLKIQTMVGTCWNYNRRFEEPNWQLGFLQLGIAGRASKVSKNWTILFEWLWLWVPVCKQHQKTIYNYIYIYINVYVGADCVAKLWEEEFIACCRSEPRYFMQCAKKKCIWYKIIRSNENMKIGTCRLPKKSFLLLQHTSNGPVFLTVDPIDAGRMGLENTIYAGMHRLKLGFSHTPHHFFRTTPGQILHTLRPCDAVHHTWAR